jgi:regulator of replication initiation timing
MELPNEIKDLKLLVSVLLKRIDDLENEVITLRSENVKLREEKSALQSRLNINIMNSHKPASSDGRFKQPSLPVNLHPKELFAKSGENKLSEFDYHVE